VYQQVGSKQYLKNIAGIKGTWWKQWKKYKTTLKKWRGKLYKAVPGSYLWRNAWNKYRAYNTKTARWGGWYVKFLLHQRRMFRSDTSSYKAINKSVMKWRASNKKMRNRLVSTN
jgi:hypothetical protein